MSATSARSPAATEVDQWPAAFGEALDKRFITRGSGR